MGQWVGAVNQFPIVGEEGVPRVHVVPVEVVARIPVPNGSEGVLATFVLEQVEAARRINLHIVEELVQLQDVNERRDVHQAVHLLIIVRLDGILQHGKVCTNRVHRFR